MRSAGAGIACTSCRWPAGSRYHTAPASGRQPAGQHVQQRGLAGAGLADHRQHLAWPEIDIHIDQRGDARRTIATGRGRTAKYRRSFRGLLQALGADMAGGAALRAVVGVGADEQPSATVVDHHLVEIRVGGAAQPAGMRRADRRGTDGRRNRASAPRSRAGSRRCASRARRRTTAAPASCASSDCRTPGSGLATSGSGGSPSPDSRS